MKRKNEHDDEMIDLLCSRIRESYSASAITHTNDTILHPYDYQVVRVMSEASTAATPGGRRRWAERRAAELGEDSIRSAFLRVCRALAESQRLADEKMQAADARERKALAKLPAAVRYHYASARLQARYRRWAGEKIANVTVSRLAYDLTDFGRLRKTYAGRWTARPTIRTQDNGKCGWDKVVWHYANYCAVRLDQTPIHRVFFAYPEHTEIVYGTPRGLYREKQFYAYHPQRLVAVTVHAHHIVRALRAHCPAICEIRWDREARRPEIVEKSTGERYHVETTPHRETEWYRSQILAAVAAFRKRRLEAATSAARTAAEARIRERAESVYVSVEDSYDSGNCHPLSDQFASEMWAALGAVGPCAVRADLILARRDDSYTRRAVLAAAIAH